MSKRAPTPAGRRRERGQSLVEFAMIFPIFLVLLLGIIEFGFMFNGQLSLNYATRDAALIAAEAGNNSIADCLILKQINQDLNQPTDESRILTVHIFSADQTGHPVSGIETTYTRGGSTSCGSMTVPYTLTSNNYPYNARCSDLDRSSCSPSYTSAGNTGVDIIGVKIDYGYRYVTPLGSVMRLLPGSGAPLWSGTGMTMYAANAMRMEPIL
jgi:Flp pilus assembly protein TadG